uniref:Sulfotransferase domain-containing protein n=1 Tax=Acrobeloides nanus TaxID=290746 RepID=A0A914DUI1_9BILA
MGEISKDISSTLQANEEVVEILHPKGGPRLNKMDGQILPIFTTPQIWKSIKEMKPRNSDVFICTYPKSGTTFMKQICAQLLDNNYRIDQANQKLDLKTSSLEKTGSEVIEVMPDPRLIKTHLNYNLAPKNSEAKYIYVVRNPKDVVVSYYFHCKLFKYYGFKNGKLDVFFDIFLAGEVEWGCYFEHLLSWLTHIDEPNILLIKYEDMLEDIDAIVKKIGFFIGGNAAETVSNTISLQQVIEQSRFDSMKENQDRLFVHVESYFEGGGNFMRKGCKRDWKNYLTREQSERIDQAFVKHLTGTIAENWWKEEMKWDED